MTFRDTLFWIRFWFFEKGISWFFTLYESCFSCWLSPGVFRYFFPSLSLSPFSSSRLNSSTPEMFQLMHLGTFTRMARDKCERNQSSGHSENTTGRVICTLFLSPFLCSLHFVVRMLVPHLQKFDLSSCPTPTIERNFTSSALCLNGLSSSCARSRRGDRRVGGVLERSRCLRRMSRPPLFAFERLLV